MTTRIIDASIAATTPEIMPYRPSKALRDFTGGGITEDQFVATMDQFGIDCAIIAATRGRDWAIPPELIRDMAERHPGRFYGTVGIGIYQPQDSLRLLYRAVDQYGFKGMVVYPHWLQAAPTRPEYDQFYDAAIELGVPAVMQIGFSFKTLAATGKDDMQAVMRRDFNAVRDRMAWYCHPVYLDDICRRFPKLKIVAGHGWPWTSDLVALAREHPNIYISTALAPPSTWEPDLVSFLKGDGRSRVIWATTYPELSIETALAELKQLELSPEVIQALTWDNAIAAFSLPK